MRLYLMLRVMRNHSGFYGQQIHFVAHMNGIDSLSIFFNFKMLLKYRPLLLLLPLFFTNFLATGCALCVLERSNPASPISSFGDGVYLTLITMSTVGYGDLKAVTPLGKATIVCGGIFGGIIMSTLLVATFVDGSETTTREEFLINLVQKRQYSKDERHFAADCLQMLYLRKRARSEADAGVATSAANLPEIDHRLHDNVHRLRLLRKSKPDELTEDERTSQLSKRLQDTVTALYGKEKYKQNQQHSTGLGPGLVGLIERQTDVADDLQDVLQISYGLIDRE
jgi:hypothetical protein